ncbi:glycosyltransferase [Clostridium perfringens]|uniref:glycosyltransferase family 4 protein n=1 Tax=Clostridium perfringens TaxID=1502 RepID=UPI0018E439AF|nr:glycosyltransferase [Clostridium perfringens]MBI6022004.1 glycosyltransferase [Clostridium perfringens]MDH2340213.1 glycosyltransferase [Clostridium perfringens]HDI3014529.1 glycosyltransferase [Clostridium perfringens]
MNKNILIFIGSYLPGTKSAGVTTSIKNLIDNLYSDFNFYIITADRDIGDKTPYKNVEKDKWTVYENCNIFYSSKYKKSVLELKNIINSINFDLYYFNGFYNYVDIARVLPLYFFKTIPNKPIVIAPRGIFSMGDYKNKEVFRKIYRIIFKILQFDKKVYWHSTSDEETKDIIKYFPKSEKNIYNISNLAKKFEYNNTYEFNLEKKPGNIKIIFISRISEKKNIKFILETVRYIEGEIEIDIYGMIGTDNDRQYWSECEEIIKTLNNNIKVRYYGEIPSDKVGETFKKYHLFFFPTFGENYGHVIAESISNGCPVLLSNTTPWNDLKNEGAGWIFPLNDINKFQETLIYIINMNQNEWSKYSENCIIASKKLINNDDSIIKYKNLLSVVK